MPKIEPIKPQNVIGFFDTLRKHEGEGNVSEALMQAGRTGAFGEPEAAIVEGVLLNLELEHDDYFDLGKFLSQELGIAESRDVAFQVALFLLRVTRTPGAHRTPEERIDALHHEFASEAAQWGKSYKPATVPKVNGKVPEKLVTLFERLTQRKCYELDSETTTCIARNLVNYGFVVELVDGVTVGTGKYTSDGVRQWWREALASYRDFGAEWEKYRPTTLSD
ncbi:MAG TPA: hypothetical protein VI953_03120 [Candidatus Paceibacterota bacterium]